MAKPVIVEFSKGIQFPPKLGSLILKKTSAGKLAYAKNVDSFNDVYGAGAVTPGPTLTTITNNSDLTGVPFVKAFYGSSALTQGYLYFAQGILGAGNVIRRIKDIVSGSTPLIDTTHVITLNHNGHNNQKVVDLVLRGTTIYISGKDDSDTWVNKMDADSGVLHTPEVPAIATNSTMTSGLTDRPLVLGSDNNIYWIGQDHISSIDINDNYVADALLNKLPIGTYGTAGVDWQLNLVVAYSTDAYGDFGRRFSAGRSGIIIWDYSNANFQKKVQAPCKYISVLIIDPSGNMLVFGGVDEGKSSIYEFTGFGFNLLYTYIGDLPRSRHSVDFDGQGRLYWLTADGQYCRFDRASGTFDYLGTILTDSSAGGLLAKAIGSPAGNEFIAASGNGTSYLMKRISFGQFTGGDAGRDSTTQPHAVSGIQELPNDSTISAITFNLVRPLEAGQKVTLFVYPNGNISPTTYLTIDGNLDIGISSKRETLTLGGLDNFSLGILWQLPDGSITAPAVLPAVVEIT